MKQIRSTKEKDNNSGLFFAGVTGAILGIGVAVVASIAMKDEKTKKQIKDISMSFYDMVKEHVRKTNIKRSSQPKKTVKKLGAGLKKTKKST